MAEAGIDLNIKNLMLSNAIIEHRMSGMVLDLNDLNRQATEFTKDKNEALKNARAIYGEDSSAYESIKEEIQDDFDYRMALVEDETVAINTQKSVDEAQHKANDTLLEGFKQQRSQNIQKDFGYFSKKK